MSTTRIPLTPHITFIDPTTKKECKVFKHPSYDTDIDAPAAAANFGYAGADNFISEQDAAFLQMLFGLAEAKAASSQQANSEEVVNLQDMDELNISLPSP